MRRRFVPGRRGDGNSAGRSRSIDRNRTSCLNTTTLQSSSTSHSAYGASICLDYALSSWSQAIWSSERCASSRFACLRLISAQADDRGLPVLTLNYPTPSLDPRVVVRAIILSPATDDQDLDLREWAEAIELAEEE